MSLDIETLPSISYDIKLFNQIRLVKLESLKFMTHLKPKCQVEHLRP